MPTSASRGIQAGMPGYSVRTVRQSNGARKDKPGIKGKGLHTESLANALTTLAVERRGARVLINGATRKNYIALRNAIKRNALPYRVESNLLGLWLIPAREDSSATLLTLGADTRTDNIGALSGAERREYIAQRIHAEIIGLMRGNKRTYSAPSRVHIASRGAAWHVKKYQRAIAALVSGGNGELIARLSDSIAAFDSSLLVGKPCEDISFGALVDCLLHTPFPVRFGAANRADDFSALCSLANVHSGVQYSLERATRAPRSFGAFIRPASPESGYTRRPGKATVTFAPDLERRAELFATLDAERAEHASKLAPFFARHGGRQEI